MSRQARINLSAFVLALPMAIAMIALTLPQGL